MTGAFDQLRVVQLGTPSFFGKTSSDAWLLQECPNCGGTQAIVLGRDDSAQVIWMRCVNCKHGMVSNHSVTSPGPRPLRTPLGIPVVEGSVWEEVRDCISVGASHAAVMLCRKLLFHIAVGHGLDEKDGRGRAPTFTDAVTHLESEGFITAVMRPWVDRIKDVGGGATHEIEPVSIETALDVARFTEQLLRLTYEMAALMAHPEQDATET